MENVSTGRNFSDFASIFERLHAYDALRSVKLINSLIIILELDNWNYLRVLINKGSVQLARSLFLIIYSKTPLLSPLGNQISLSLLHFLII